MILALTGAGGGILAVPLLVFGLQMNVAQAGPIGLRAVGIAAALGAILCLREGIVRYRAALLIVGAGMLLSPLGATLFFNRRANLSTATSARSMRSRWLLRLHRLSARLAARSDAGGEAGYCNSTRVRATVVGLARPR